jgi:hypothetical protein
VIVDRRQTPTIIETADNGGDQSHKIGSSCNAPRSQRTQAQRARRAGRSMTRQRHCMERAAWIPNSKPEHGLPWQRREVDRCDAQGTRRQRWESVLDMEMMQSRDDNSKNTTLCTFFCVCFSSLDTRRKRANDRVVCSCRTIVFGSANRAAGNHDGHVCSGVWGARDGSGCQGQHPVCTISLHMRGYSVVAGCCWMTHGCSEPDRTAGGCRHFCDSLNCGGG